PLEYGGTLSAMLEASGGDVLALDASRGAIVLAHGDVSHTFVRLTRVADVGRTRLTLARRLDAPGVAVVGISASSGDVVAGELDVGRAIVGPLSSLGDWSSLVDAGKCIETP